MILDGAGVQHATLQSKLRRITMQQRKTLKGNFALLRTLRAQIPRHVGRNFVSTLLDSFNLPTPHGTHVCMVFDPLREPLWMLRRRFQGDVLPLDLLRPVAKLILEGLGYLHSECQVVHTGIASMQKRGKL